MNFSPIIVVMCCPIDMVIAHYGVPLLSIIEQDDFQGVKYEVCIPSLYLCVHTDYGTLFVLKNWIMM